ncbi:MAG: YggS family pyridoxal phosphate-dependent enzyme [Candidatus Hydrogenedentes bacterium]|nr:YggS family pyridoxal phosphate-dependent enzyme [Candidatus Hydrogenedentota bacterium]
MALVSDRIAENLRAIQSRMEAACRRANRNPNAVTLVAVTKGRSIEDVRALYALGVRDFGENRVADAEPKIAVLPGDIRWHMIGSVQRRKAPAVVRLFQRVDSVDRLELAEALNARARERGVFLRCLVEVNVSGEDTKHGVEPASLGSLLNAMSALEFLHVEGLMTMAPLVDDPESVRPFFRCLQELARLHGMPALSMGMSGDFEVAIEEGATEIRVGMALFQ